MWRRIPATAGKTGASRPSSYRRAAYATVGATSVALAGYYYNVQKRQQEMHDDFELPPHSSMIYLEPQQVASTRDPTRPHAFWAPPSREDMLHMLQNGPGTLLAGKQQQQQQLQAVAGSKGSTPTPTTPTTEVVSSTKDEDDSDVFDLLIIGGGATGAGCAVDAATRGLKVAMVERDDFSSGKKDEREDEVGKKSRHAYREKTVDHDPTTGWNGHKFLFFHCIYVTITSGSGSQSSQPSRLTGSKIKPNNPWKSEQRN